LRKIPRGQTTKPFTHPGCAALRIKRLLNTDSRRELNQKEAGKIFGGGVNAFSRYENGKTKPPLAFIAPTVFVTAIKLRKHGLLRGWSARFILHEIPRACALCKINLALRFPLNLMAVNLCWGT
jgi:hypothetical protein